MFGSLGVYEGQMASEFSVELPLPLAAGEGEAELVARALKGDHQAYANLVRPHERVAYRVAAAITGWNADAEEATQNGLREGVPIAPPLPQRSRIQAVAAPDRRQRGAQRGPSRTTP